MNRDGFHHDKIWAKRANVKSPVSLLRILNRDNTWDKRDDYFTSSAHVLDWAEQHPGRACVSWLRIANLFYLAEGFTGNASAFDYVHAPKPPVSGHFEEPGVVRVN